MHYNQFVVNLDMYVGSCNTINNLSNKVDVSNKTEDLNLRTSNMITWINELKNIKKHISFECKHKLDGRKYKSNQKGNNNKCWCECKTFQINEKKKLYLKSCYMQLQKW